MAMRSFTRSHQEKERERRKKGKDINWEDEVKNKDRRTHSHWISHGSRWLVFYYDLCSECVRIINIKILK